MKAISDKCKKHLMRWFGRILSHFIRFDPKWRMYYLFGSSADAIAFVDELKVLGPLSFSAEEHVIPLSEYKVRRFPIIDTHKIRSAEEIKSEVDLW